VPAKKIALDTARKEYCSRNRRSQAHAAIYEAWHELIEKGYRLLVDLLASAVESKSGVRADVDDVAEFFAALGKPVIVGTAASKTSAEQAARNGGSSAVATASSAFAAASARAGKLILRGKGNPYHNSKDAMVIVLRELAKVDSTFIERCPQHTATQGFKRRYSAHTPEELYPDRENLRDMRESLPGGWLGAPNPNNIFKKTMIKLAPKLPD